MLYGGMIGHRRLHLTPSMCSEMASLLLTTYYNSAETVAIMSQSLKSLRLLEDLILMQTKELILRSLVISWMSNNWHLHLWNQISHINKPYKTQTILSILHLLSSRSYAVLSSIVRYNKPVAQTIISGNNLKNSKQMNLFSLVLTKKKDNLLWGLNRLWNNMFNLFGIKNNNLTVQT